MVQVPHGELRAFSGHVADSRDFADPRILRCSCPGHDRTSGAAFISAQVHDRDPNWGRASATAS